MTAIVQADGGFHFGFSARIYLSEYNQNLQNGEIRRKNTLRL